MIEVKYDEVTYDDYILGKCVICGQVICSMSDFKFDNNNNVLICTKHDYSE